MNLLKRAQQCLTGMFQKEAAVIQQDEENLQSTVAYHAFIGSRSVMDALNLRPMGPPKITLVDRPTLYRVRPGDTYESICHSKDFLADVYDIQHPALLDQKRAFLMLPDTLTNARALSVTTTLEREISQNPVDDIYVCLDQRLTDDNLSSILALLGTFKAHLNTVPIYCVQLTEDIDPVEGRQLLRANMLDLDEVQFTGHFQISDIDATDSEYVRFQDHLQKRGTELQTRNRTGAEKKCLEILNACRQSVIDQQRLIHIKEHVFPTIPSPAMLAQRDHARRAAEIKSALMGIFKLVANGKNGEVLLKKVMAYVEDAKKPGEYERATLRASSTIYNDAIEALNKAIQNLNDSHMAILRRYLDQINTALRDSGYPEIAMPNLVPFSLSENANADEIELKPALMSQADCLFRVAIGGSIGTSSLLMLAKLLAELGVITGSAAGLPGQIVVGTTGFVLGTGLSLLMIEGANARAYNFEYEKRVSQAISAVASETEPIFNQINVEANYVVYDTLMIIEAEAKKHLSVFEAKVQELDRMSDAELAKLLAELESTQKDIESVLDEAGVEDVTKTETDAEDADADTTDDVENGTAEDGAADTTTDADAEDVENNADAETQADTTQTDTEKQS